MIDSEKNNSAKCFACRKPIKKDGKVLNGQFYHSVCCDSIGITMANKEDKPKKVYIAV